MKHGYSEHEKVVKWLEKEWPSTLKDCNGDRFDAFNYAVEDCASDLCLDTEYVSEIARSWVFGR